MSENSIQLPVFDTIETAWKKVKGSKCTFWAVLICIFIIKLCTSGLDKLVDSNDALAVVIGLVELVLYIVTLFLEWGLIYIAIQRAMDLGIQFSLVKNVLSIKLFFRMIGVIILSFIVLLPPILLLVAPTLFWHFMDTSEFSDTLDAICKILTAVCYVISIVWMIYWGIRLSLSQALVIAKNSGPVAAIKLSFMATKGNVLRILGVSLINFFLVLVSAIPFGIGLIWTLPLSYITFGEIYKKLVVSRSDINK